MANGGIYDQLGGGFHRYSVDERWFVPHFEKMLYDQAQLAIAYLEAHQITHDPFFASVARNTLDYVLRDMTHSGGGFYSAEDADSAADPAKPTEKSEGAFYLWTRQEIDQLLGHPEASIFSDRYGVAPEGNVHNDPHGEFTGKNILFVHHTLEQTTSTFHISEETVGSRIEKSAAKLLAHRGTRPRPHLDDKILTAWNGLMISAFARGYEVLGDHDYLDAATKAAHFLREKLYHADGHTLRRSYREGASDVNGFASDYAFLIQGLLDLYAAGFDSRNIGWAEQLQEQQNSAFWDEAHGGYFNTSGQDKNVLLRMKEEGDGAEPSPNSVSALNLLRLAAMLDKKIAREQAEKTLHAFDTRLKQAPVELPQMLVALDWFLATPKQVVIAGKPGAADTMAMLSEVHRHFIPNKVLMLADGGAGQQFFSTQVEFMKDVAPIDDRATAFVCENFVCQLPTTDVGKSSQLLTAKGSRTSKPQ